MRLDAVLIAEGEGVSHQDRLAFKASSTRRRMATSDGAATAT
jgi:hypothetical protein